MESASSSSETKSSQSKSSHKILTGLLISFVTLVLCLGGLELAGYLWERSTAQGLLGWTLVASRRMDLERHGTEERPYYLLKPGKDYLWRGIPVHIDSRGFRTEEFEVSKPLDTYRILNLGDSVVFGWEVRQEDTYGKQLERMLNAHQDGLHYEVINVGIPAWNPEAERNFLLQEGISYQPDLVIFDLTLVNDIYGRGPDFSETPNLFQWLRDHTYAWPFLTTETRFLLARRFGPEAIPVLNPPLNAGAYFPLNEDSPVWDHIWGYVAEVQQACKEQGIDLMIVVFPTAFQLNSYAHPDTPQKAFAKRAAKAGITFLDLLPVYRQVCDGAVFGTCEGYENLLFADVWMHPNKLGHKLAAERLYSSIIRFAEDSTVPLK